MSDSFEIRPVSDCDSVNSILTDPWVAERLRHDAREPGFIEHDALFYHGAYADDRLVGVFTAIEITPWEIEVHAAFVREAMPLARHLAREYLGMLWSFADLQRITAPVLGTLPSAVNWCRKLGFVPEGVRRRACRVNGIATDVVMLGMTRGDWRQSLEGPWSVEGQRLRASTQRPTTGNSTPSNIAESQP